MLNWKKKTNQKYHINSTWSAIDYKAKLVKNGREKKSYDLFSI